MSLPHPALPIAASHRSVSALERAPLYTRLETGWPCLFLNCTQQASACLFGLRNSFPAPYLLFPFHGKNGRQNGEANVVIQDIERYEQDQATMALLKILALGNRQIEEGKVIPAVEVVKRLRERGLKR